MFRRGAAQFDHGAEPPRIALQKCGRVEPKARKHRRTVQPIVSDRSWHQHTLFLTEPEDFVRFDRADDVFQHPGPLVIGLLWPQVHVPCRLGNLDNQLRGAVDVAFFLMAPAAAFGEDAEQRIRLRLALPAEDGGGVAQPLNAGRVLYVGAEPRDHREMSAAVGATKRAGHINHSIDQFGPGSGRHRLVERVKRGLVKSLTFDQRARRGFHCRAIGHEPTLSSWERDPNRVAPTPGEDRRELAIKAYSSYHRPAVPSK